MIFKKSILRLSRQSSLASSGEQAPTPKMIFSFADHKRYVTLCQLLITIDKRINGSGSKQKKAAPTPSYAKATKGKQGRKIGSLKKRAYLLIMLALSMFVAALLLVHIQHNEPINGMYSSKPYEPSNAQE